jgi:hypothetical protein
MSKILKKALKRVSWRPSEGTPYPVTAPEVPAGDQGIIGNGRIGNGSTSSHLNGIFEVERPEEEEDVGDPITLAIIGAGQRGKVWPFSQTLDFSSIFSLLFATSSSLTPISHSH